MGVRLCLAVELNKLGLMKLLVATKFCKLFHKLYPLYRSHLLGRIIKGESFQVTEYVLILLNFGLINGLDSRKKNSRHTS